MAEIPDDLKDRWRRLSRLALGSKAQRRWAATWMPLLERIADLTAANNQLRRDITEQSRKRWEAEHLANDRLQEIVQMSSQTRMNAKEKL